MREFGKVIGDNLQQLLAEGLDNFQKLIVTGIFLLAAFALIYAFWLRYEVEGIRVYAKEKRRTYVNLAIVLGAALLVKLIFAAVYAGHETDMNCFYSWSDMIFDNGFGEFYYLDAFTDYPPGYMAILWVIAGIRRLFSIETVSTLGRILIKLVPVLSDMAASVLVYVLAKKRFSEPSSLVLALTYALNPIVVLDSSVWGQTDGVFTFFVLLTAYLCMEEKRIPAYFAFAVGVLIKPQTLIFTPILIWTIIEQVFLKDFDTKKMLRDLIGGLAAIAMMFLLILPFGIEKVLHQYVDTLGSYEYCTINAYNFWALFGRNWQPQSDKFLFLECRQWGTLAILVAVVLSAFIFFKLKEDKSKYFLSLAVVVSTMFLFSVRMHERYLFPVVALLLCAFLVKPTKQLFFTYVGFSFVQLINVGHVLYYFDEYESTGPQGGIIGMTAIMTMVLFGYMIYASFTVSEMEDLEETGARTSRKNGIVKPYRERPERKKKPVEHVREKFSILRSKETKKFTKWDWILLGSIMLVYSIFALADLGNREAPETAWSTDEAGTVIQLDMGENRNVDMIHVFLGHFEGRKFTLDLSQDGQNYETVGELTANSVFAWNDLKQEDNDGTSYNLAKEYRYLRLTSNSEKAVLREMVITDRNGNILTPVNTADYPALFDEQQYYDPLQTFRSGTYFDEIYHARTAYEMTQDKLYCYENTHPPLGKFFISLGIRVFGMNPFGWRIVGVLFGIAMLPFIYLFARRMFGGMTWAASVATFLFAFDFMHFVQTRISTIDVYGTFFIIAMYFFMYQYAQMSFYDTPLKKTFIPLGLSAVMMGLGCASKWTAVYAAAGLGVFFFVILGVRYYEYTIAKRSPEGSSNGIAHSYITEVFWKKTLITVGFCVLFFIVIAGLIYLLSYIPFYDGTDRGLWERMIENQKTMYNYHSQLEASHPYESPWFEWPAMIKPMYYYCKTVADGLREGISAFGNPLVWWAGIPAFIYMIYLIVRERDRVAIFLSFSYLVQYVPWMLVPRCMFAYHYFPSVPFIVLMIVYVMVRLYRRNEKWLKWILLYCGLAFVLFLLFYPVLSGHAVTDTYVRDGLRWLEGWVLTS